MAKTITTLEELDTYKATGHAVAVHFYADWAAPCKQMDAVAAILAKKHPLMKFIKVDAEESPDISEIFDITAVPTFVFLLGDQTVARVNGVNTAELGRIVAEYADITVAIPSSKITQENTDKCIAHVIDKSIDDRLHALINRAPVMLFMKGDQEQPQCGFSRKIVNILNEQAVSFETFDILSDDEVRQGLKKYSDWPTYPQLYSNGELLGGLDIVKEMILSGEFKSSLPSAAVMSLDERLRTLINNAPVMLFMKGNRNEPRCGFSKTIVQILNDQGVNYETFDILSNEEVRQGLKKFSDWPTYPQLYSKGELIGGLDIVKEMINTGEFKAALE